MNYRSNKPHNDKKIIWSLLALGLVASFIGSRIEYRYGTFANLLHDKPQNINLASVIEAQNETPPVATLLPPKSFTLGFVGDIMLDRGVRKSVKNNFNSDYSKLFENADFLKTPDVMFANLEGPASDQGTNLHNLYSFRMNPKVIPILRDAGVDVVSFANNHVGDWGRPAFEDTLARLKASGILACGAGMTKTEAEQPAIIEQDNFRIGYLCFSDVGPNNMAATDTESGVLLASDPDFDAIVQNATHNVDALVVSFHWGTEYQKWHSARQGELAKRAIDDGAAMIAGSHPHVVGDSETYKGVPIFYSLGNFIFDQSFSSKTMHGEYVEATLTNNAVTHTIVSGTKLSSEFVPSLDLSTPTQK